MICPLGSTCFRNYNSAVISHQSRIFISEMNCKESFRTSGQEQRGDRKVVVFSSMQRQQKGGWNEKKWEDTAEDTLSLSELCDGLDSVFRPWKKKIVFL